MVIKVRRRGWPPIENCADRGSIDVGNRCLSLAGVMGKECLNAPLLEADEIPCILIPSAKNRRAESTSDHHRTDSSRALVLVRSNI